MNKENKQTEPSKWVRVEIGEDGRVIIQEDSTFLSSQDIIRLRPTTVRHLTDKEWIILVRLKGFSGACSGMFRLYTGEQYEQGLSIPPPRAEAPGKWEEVILGEAGSEGFRLTGGLTPESTGANDLFVSFMTERNWKPEQLGLFGKWLEASGVDPRFAKPILRSFLCS